jgi:hypothetical protein
MSKSAWESADEVEGVIDLGSIMAEGVSDIGPPQGAEDTEQRIAEGREGLGRASVGGLARVLAESHVAWVVDPVFD